DSKRHSHQVYLAETAQAMPDRNHVAALITTFNQTSQSLQGWQDKITTATVALVEHAHALHDAEVAAALAATPVPTVVATGKPVNTALTAASFYALFEDIGLAGTAPTATSLNPFAALAETDSAATNGPTPSPR
ncbi:hypothetical protein ABC639_12430, partial [Lacticaseibacillus paracasei]|uniref:hypothetical protein n=1 Tax=Lacticaseibacillus paracasei TaxID=1597 RepID=UPI0031D146BD